MPPIGQILGPVSLQKWRRIKRSPRQYINMKNQARVLLVRNLTKSDIPVLGPRTPVANSELFILRSKRSTSNNVNTKQKYTYEIYNMIPCGGPRYHHHFFHICSKKLLVSPSMRYVQIGPRRSPSAFRCLHRSGLGRNRNPKLAHCGVKLYII